MDAVQLGNRLRAARDRRGLSQQAVADALGLPRTAITNMETGARAVSTLEMTKLADLYGQTPAYFLSPNEEGTEDLLVVLHRVAPDIAKAPETEREVSRILDLYREGAGLRSLLGQASEQTVPNYATRLSSVGDAIRQGEVVAQEERRRLRLGIAPIANAAEMISEPRGMDCGDGPAERPLRVVCKPPVDRISHSGECEPPTSAASVFIRPRIRPCAV